MNISKNNVGTALKNKSFYSYKYLTQLHQRGIFLGINLEIKTSTNTVDSSLLPGDFSVIYGPGFLTNQLEWIHFFLFVCLQ